MKSDKMKSGKPKLIADWNALKRTFIRPENDASRDVLVKYMEQILFGLHGFLRKHVGITEEVSLLELSKNFSSSIICENPEKKLADVIQDLVKEIAPQAVNVTSPYFVGHMTSAIPFFMVHLKAIVAALNQNVVKLETSKVVSVLEKQVLAKVHRLVFRENQQFYDEHVQNTQSTLGSFVEDGTLANLTALWVARNSFLAPKDGFKGVEKEGMHAAYKAYDIERLVVLVSRLGHYSLRKAGGVLGLGNQNIVPVTLDGNNRIDLDALKKTIETIQNDSVKTKIFAIVGIAGATETGTIDPLVELGKICAENKVHFHVDAAWGGPTLMSKKYRSLLKGIELADSVTMDGHKQFYMPMTCGMVYFRDPLNMDTVAYHANYVNRPGSVDLGIKSLSGSREASSLILDSSLKIMGSQGYALLIEHGIETAIEFAKEIVRRPDFEIITYPELNILTYRLFPAHLRKKFFDIDGRMPVDFNEELNIINLAVQRMQREAGKSFVSRTRLRTKKYPGQEIVVLRCVIMNPMTNLKILKNILNEQEAIYKSKIWKGGV